MITWSEKEYAKLQYLLDRCECFGRKISLEDNDCFTLMAAFLLGYQQGVEDESDGDADESLIAGLYVD